MNIYKILKNKPIIIAMSVLLTAGIMFLIVLPTGKKIKNLNAEIYKQRMSLERLYLRGQSIKESQSNYEQVKDKIKILDDIFNHSGEELEFITALEDIANFYNIKQIIDIQNNSEKKKKDKNYEAIRVDLTLQGTFPNIAQYLDNIQTLDFYFNIDSLNFYYPQSSSFKQYSQDEEEKEFQKSKINPLINASLSGLTYWK